MNVCSFLPYSGFVFGKLHMASMLRVCTTIMFRRPTNKHAHITEHPPDIKKAVVSIKLNKKREMVELKYI